MGTMALTAAIPNFRPSKCINLSDCPGPQTWQLGILFLGLGLLAIGAGGIRPCNIAFGADQFDTNTEKGRKQLETFFNWWYLSFTLSLLIALTAVVYVQTNISWFIGFLIPTICLGLSIAIFLIGRHTYITLKPQGSVFSDIAKVVVASCRKHRVRPTTIEPSFYNPPGSTGLNHMDKLKFLDKAAMIIDPNTEFNTQGKPKNRWRLCSLQQVDDFKCLISIIPVWITGILCFMLMDQASTFGILQGLQMNNSIGSNFEIPVGWMGLTSMIMLTSWIIIYEGICIPIMKTLTKKEKRLTIQKRIGIGIFMSIMSTFVAGIVETKRRETALKSRQFKSPISISYLLPQFMFCGLNEAFAAVAQMEFLTTHMPDNMRTVAGAIFFLSLSISSYCCSILVTVIHSVTGRNGNLPWLGGHDLNRNKLENYYYVLTGLGVVNLLYFTVFGRRYVFDVKRNTELETEQNQEV